MQYLWRQCKFFSLLCIYFNYSRSRRKIRKKSYCAAGNEDLFF